MLKYKFLEAISFLFIYILFFIYTNISYTKCNNFYGSEVVFILKWNSFVSETFFYRKKTKILIFYKIVILVKFDCGIFCGAWINKEINYVLK